MAIQKGLLGLILFTWVALGRKIKPHKIQGCQLTKFLFHMSGKSFGCAFDYYLQNFKVLVSPISRATYESPRQNEHVIEVGA